MGTRKLVGVTELGLPSVCLRGGGVHCTSRFSRASDREQALGDYWLSLSGKGVDTVAFAAELLAMEGQSKEVARVGEGLNPFGSC